MKTYEAHCVDFFKSIQDLVWKIDLDKAKGVPLNKGRIVYMLNAECDLTARRIAADAISGRDKEVDAEAGE